MRHIISVLFLDVDGVINTDRNRRYQNSMGRNTSSYRIYLPPTQLNNLAIINECVQDLRIVLCSKWRLGGSPSPARANLESQLKRYGIYIYSETPFLNHQRDYEISSWLDRFLNNVGYIPPYVILDNEIDILLPAHKGHVVCCQSEFGLTTKEVNISINLLNRQKVDMLRL